MFSVIIPVYNRGETLSKTLQSVTRSFIGMHCDYEIILIDDGSTPENKFIHSRLAKTTPLCSYVSVNENRGVSHARNTGTKLAKFEWLLFLDADDFFSQEKIKVLAKFLDKMINNSEQNLKQVDMIAHDSMPQMGFKYKRNTIQEVLKYELLFSNFITTPSVCLRNKGYKFDENFRHMEDWKLWLEVSESARIIWLPDRLTELGGRVSEGNGLSSQHYSMRKAQIKIIMKSNLNFLAKYCFISFYVFKELFRQLNIAASCRPGRGQFRWK